MTALLLAIVSSAAMALALKWFRDPKGNRYGLLLGNYLTCVLIAFLTMPDRGAVLHGSAVTLICGLIGGCFFIAALVAMQSSIAKTGAALTAAFAKLGLTVSLLVSVLWFGERPTALQLGGIVLTLAALGVLHGGAAAPPEQNTGEGGVWMSLEAITSVTRAEQEAKNAVAAAQAKAKQLLAEAQAAGEASLEAARAKADSELEALRKKAEEKSRADAEALGRGMEAEREEARLEGGRRRRGGGRAELLFLVSARDRPREAARDAGLSGLQHRDHPAGHGMQPVVLP